MNKASCLSLLSNAILLYNLAQLEVILERAATAGQHFSPETIAHVSPLLHEHVIVNGTYDFSQAQPRQPVTQ